MTPQRLKGMKALVKVFGPSTAIPKARYTEDAVTNGHFAFRVSKEELAFIGIDCKMEEMDKKVMDQVLPNSVPSDYIEADPTGQIKVTGIKRHSADNGYRNDLLKAKATVHELAAVDRTIQMVGVYVQSRYLLLAIAIDPECRFYIKSPERDSKYDTQPVLVTDHAGEIIGVIMPMRI